NALKVANWLSEQDAVEWVSYPGLSNHPSYDLAQKYLPKGQGAILTFGIKGGKDAGIKVLNATKLFSHVANVGDSKSLIIHPASTTHSQLTEAQLDSAGVSPNMIRLSIGTENIIDIIQDL